jgi:hypothetical protein
MSGARYILPHSDTANLKVYIWEKQDVLTVPNQSRCVVWTLGPVAVEESCDLSKRRVAPLMGSASPASHLISSRESGGKEATRERSVLTHSRQTAVGSSC